MGRRVPEPVIAIPAPSSSSLSVVVTTARLIGVGKLPVGVE
nr:hypothetical protein [Mycobacteroides abscessus]